MRKLTDSRLVQFFAVEYILFESKIHIRSDCELIKTQSKIKYGTEAFRGAFDGVTLLHWNKW